MPVRVDNPVVPPSGPGQRSGRAGRLGLVLALVAATIAGLVLGVVIVRATSQPDVGSAPTNAGIPDVSNPAVSRAPRVVEALPRSAIVAGGGGVDRIHELPIGYAKTTDGAVQAAMNFLITDVSPAYYNQAHYEAIQAYMFASPRARQQMGYSQSAIDALRNKYQVDVQGRPLTGGRPDPDKRIWDAVYPQYGAYRIVEAAPAEVRVMVWAPSVFGVDRKDAATTAKLQIGWILNDATVSWVDGDWKQSDNNVYPRDEVPKPADPQQVVTSYAERADLLGTDLGWTLPANAAETDTPELQLPGK